MMEQFKYNFNKTKRLTTIIIFLFYFLFELGRRARIRNKFEQRGLSSMMQTIGSTGSIVVACLRHRHHLSVIVVWNDKSWFHVIGLSNWSKSSNKTNTFTTHWLSELRLAKGSLGNISEHQNVFVIKTMK